MMSIMVGQEEFRRKQVGLYEGAEMKKSMKNPSQDSQFPGQESNLNRSQEILLT
jgi:hypothetical protein